MDKIELNRVVNKTFLKFFLLITFISSLLSTILLIISLPKVEGGEMGLILLFFLIPIQIVILDIIVLIVILVKWQYKIFLFPIFSVLIAFLIFRFLFAFPDNPVDLFEVLPISVPLFLLTIFSYFSWSKQTDLKNYVEKIRAKLAGLWIFSILITVLIIGNFKIVNSFLNFFDSNYPYRKLIDINKICPDYLIPGGKLEEYEDSNKKIKLFLDQVGNIQYKQIGNLDTGDSVHCNISVTDEPLERNYEYRYLVSGKRERIFLKNGDFFDVSCGSYCEAIYKKKKYILTMSFSNYKKSEKVNIENATDLMNKIIENTSYIFN